MTLMSRSLHAVYVVLTSTQLPVAGEIKYGQSFLGMVSYLSLEVVL
jgi:hypothetical protein